MFHGNSKCVIKGKFLKLVHMKNINIMKLSPDKRNITIRVAKAKNGMEDSFSWLINEVTTKRDASERTIVYCQSIKDCGKLYCIFDEKFTNGDTS